MSSVRDLDRRREYAAIHRPADTDRADLVRLTVHHHGRGHERIIAADDRDPVTLAPARARSPVRTAAVVFVARAPHSDAAGVTADGLDLVGGLGLPRGDL